METQIIKSGQKLVNTGQTKEFLKALYPVNYFLPYPLTDSQIEDWAKFIKKTEPEITPARLDIIFEQFATGKIPFDAKIGIRNIFIGFRKITKDRLSYLNNNFLSRGLMTPELQVEKKMLLSILEKYVNENELTC